MADERQVAILKRSVPEWNQWRQANPDAKIDLRDVDFDKRDLAGADPRGADFSGANLRRVNFSGADLAGCLFKTARINKANFAAANTNPLTQFPKWFNLYNAILNHPANVQARNLIARMQSWNVPLGERARASKKLAEIGDPRPGVCTLEPDLCPMIRAGRTKLREKNEKQSYGAFQIATYPVTNWQYRQFVKETGYPEPANWADDLFNQDNQPVTAVSWDDANAYAHWLSRGTGRRYRLPTEAEWLRAAGHTDGRRYPWGKDWFDYHANINGTGLGRPSAVGLFPQGAAMCGAMDMSGNVMEWCQDQYEHYQGVHVLRSGSWLNYRVDAHMGGRVDFHSSSHSTDIGFRLVAPVQDIYQPVNLS